MSEPLRIRAESSAADPDSMRFRLDAAVQDAAPVAFESAEEAGDAPLAAALFGISGVRAVHVAGNVVTVIKDGAAQWAELKRPIGAAIRSVLQTETAPLGHGVPDADGDAALRRAVQKVLDAEANPAIARHGGHVGVRDVEGGVVRIEMSGGCQGCAASAATLRDGVERILRRTLPEIREIVDVTDHASGTNPYFSRAPQGASPLARPLPPDAITHEDGQYMVSPDYLAARLGLDSDTLRAEIRAGRVLSREERGEGADAGKVRLTARHGGRAWAAEIAPDGTAIEVPPPRA